MEVHTAEFMKSSAHPQECPAPDFPEYAFIGRSNVGKSSLINMLAHRNSLAKISGTPGKTQLINHFAINLERETGDWPLTSWNPWAWICCVSEGLRLSKVSKSPSRPGGKSLLKN